MPVSGYRSISVRGETYDKLMAIARSVGPRCGAASVIEDMLEHYEETERYHFFIDYFVKITTPPKPAFRWEGFPLKIFQAILSEVGVKEYRSTSWMKSEEYANDKVGSPQFWPIARVFTNNLEVQKVIVISPKVWNSRRAWTWVWKWVNLQRVLGDKLQVFVVREDSIPKKEVPERFFDMGIYDDLLVGYLSLNERSEPIEYAWVKTEVELETAKKKFEALKKYAVKTEDYVDVGFKSAKCLKMNI